MGEFSEIAVIGNSILVRIFVDRDLYIRENPISNDEAFATRYQRVHPQPNFLARHSVPLMWAIT